MKQSTDTLLMIRPASFRMNEETAINNYFQQKDNQENSANELAQKEFDAFVAQLRKKDVYVIVVDDNKSLDTPDALFPNNWVSFHENGDVGLFPMFAENRRRERREDVIEQIEAEGFQVKNFIDYTDAENDSVYLEGTGSLVLDRINKKAYCAISDRASEDLMMEFCEDFEYFPIMFHANQSHQGKRLPIYHTNVMMCIGTDVAVIASSTIDDQKERKTVIDSFRNDRKTIIDITEKQMHHFAGNMLEVSNRTGDKIMVMSDQAKAALSDQQINQLEKYTSIVTSDLSVIEKYGGGSARCMMAEVFLPKVD
jgi:hypothetical protein